MYDVNLKINRQVQTKYQTAEITKDCLIYQTLGLVMFGNLESAMILDKVSYGMNP